MINRRDFVKNSILTGLMCATGACPQNMGVVNEELIVQYNDAGTPTDLPIHVWYPINPNESLSLIAFSHGFAGAPNNYRNLLNNLSEQNYLVVAPEHKDVILVNNGDRLAQLQNIVGFIPDIVEFVEGVRELPPYSESTLSSLVELFFGRLISGRIEDEDIIELFGNLFSYRTKELSLSIDISYAIYGELLDEKIGLGCHSLGGIPQERYMNKNSVDAALFLSPASNLSNISKLPYPTRWVTGTNDGFYESTKHWYNRVKGDSSFVSFLEAEHINFAIPSGCNDLGGNCRMLAKAIKKCSSSFFNHKIRGIGSESDFIIGNEAIIDEYLVK